MNEWIMEHVSASLDAAKSAQADTRGNGNQPAIDPNVEPRVEFNTLGKTAAKFSKHPSLGDLTYIVATSGTASLGLRMKEKQEEQRLFNRGSTLAVTLDRLF